MRSASREALAFRNAINVLTSLDRHELEEAEVIPPGPDGSYAWSVYLQTPLTFVRRLDDDRLDRFWELMETRSAGARPPSPSSHLRVKPLQWVNGWAYGLDLWKAAGYEISRSHGEVYFLKGNGIDPASFDDLASAQAVAQTHHETHVWTLFESQSPQPNLMGVMEALREALEPFADQSEFWSDQVSDRTPLLEKDNLKVGDVRRAAKAVDEYRRWKAAQAQPAGTVAADQNAAATSRPPTQLPQPREGGNGPV